MHKLFESQKENLTVGRGGNEFNGLLKNSKPENCTILDSFVSVSEFTGTQEHYLVIFQGKTIHMRICDAYEGSGYDKFAVLLSIEDDKKPGIDIKDRFSRMKQFR